MNRPHASEPRIECTRDAHERCAEAYADPFHMGGVDPGHTVEVIERQHQCWRRVEKRFADLRNFSQECRCARSRIAGERIGNRGDDDATSVTEDSCGFATCEVPAENDCKAKLASCVAEGSPAGELYAE